MWQKSWGLFSGSPWRQCGRQFLLEQARVLILTVKKLTGRFTLRRWAITMQRQRRFPYSNHPGESVLQQKSRSCRLWWNKRFWKHWGGGQSKHDGNMHKVMVLVSVSVLVSVLVLVLVTGYFLLTKSSKKCVCTSSTLFAVYCGKKWVQTHILQIFVNENFHVT